MYSHLVNQCNGQTNRPFPSMSADQSVEAYESELKAWLHEKARCSVCHDISCVQINMYLSLAHAPGGL